MAVAVVTAQPAPLTETYIGRTKLAGGTVNVALKHITEDSVVIVSGNDAAVTGILVVVITAGTGFSVTSSVGGDAGYVGWAVYVAPSE